MKKFVFAAAAALCLATPALADDGGVYLGAGVGSMGVDIGGFSGDDVGYKVFGGWMLNPYVGAELEYLDGGTAEDRGVEVDVSGFNASLRAAFPVSEQFSVFGKVGMLFWDADVSSSGINGSDDGEDFSWGVGLGFDFSEMLGVTLEYQGFEVEDTDTVDLVSASLVWKF